MPTILPVSDLTNYNEVLSRVSENNPVYLTRHGRGEYVITKTTNMTREEAEERLFAELDKARATGFIPWEKAKEQLGVK